MTIFSPADFLLLDAAAERWPQVFGEDLAGIGFEIFPDDVPMLERCLEAKSTAELDRYLKELNSKGLRF